jgi:hypothetical protein
MIIRPIGREYAKPWMSSAAIKISNTLRYTTIYYIFENFNRFRVKKFGLPQKIPSQFVKMEFGEQPLRTMKVRM